MEAVLRRLVDHGCTITPLKDVPNAILAGLAGRDVICFIDKRTKDMQRFADHWSGAPPADLTTEQAADDLVSAIMAGEYDLDSRFEREQIIFRLRHL
jgi:hypothetical protein